MLGTRFPKILFGLLVLTALAQSILYFPKVPDRLASHFGASGAANGWMEKPVFFTLYAGLVVIAAVAVFWVPYSIANASIARINLPNKEYWWAPERRASTVGFFEKSFAWYGCALLVLEILAMQLVFRANFSPTPRLPTAPILTLVSSFALFNVAWVIYLLRRFSNLA